MIRRLSLFGIALLAAVTFIHPGKGLLAQEIQIKMEDGIPIVYNPKEPVPQPGLPSRVTLQKDLVLGGESSGPDYPFSLLSYLVVDDDENMIVLDNEESCIKIFDKSGKKIRQFGRRGEGPGDIQRPTTLTVIEGGQIGVIDPSNHRFSYFSRDGECLRELSMEKYLRIRRVKADRRGFIYANFITYVDAEKEIKSTVDLIKFDADLNPVATIGTFKQSRGRREVIMVEKRFGYDPRDDNCLVWGINDVYVLNVVSPDGETMRRIVKDYDPVKVTEEDRQEIYKDSFGERELPSDVKVNFPKYYPAYYYVFCDDECRMYVRTYEKDDQGNLYYDVFDSEGRCFTKFVLPEEEMIFAIKKNKVYTVNRSDFPVLTRYAMTWE